MKGISGFGTVVSCNVRSNSVSNDCKLFQLSIVMVSVNVRHVVRLVLPQFYEVSSLTWVNTVLTNVAECRHVRIFDCQCIIGSSLDFVRDVVLPCQRQVTFSITVSVLHSFSLDKMLNNSDVQLVSVGVYERR